MTPKSPIPMVSQREVLFKSFQVEEGVGEGKRLNISCSINHPSKDLPAGFFNHVRGLSYLGASMIEKTPDGKGVVQTEVRSMDICGNIPEWVVTSLSKSMPIKAHAAWQMKYKELST
jgi:hypothetical protein